MKFLKVTKKKAQSLIEYALILAMVAVVAIAALQLLGQNVGNALRGAGDVVGEGSDKAGENACKAMGDGFEWDEATHMCNFTGGNNGGGE